MLRIAGFGTIVMVLAGIPGCSDCNPPKPPPPPSDMALANTADPCGGLVVRTNDYPRQGPLLSGSVIGTECHLAKVKNITSAAQPPCPSLPCTLQGSASRNDGALAGIDVTLQVAAPSNPGWTMPDPNNPVCGPCTEARPAPPFYKVTYQAADGTRPLCPGGRDALLIRTFSMARATAGLPPPPAGVTFACPGSALFHCALDWGLDPAQDAVFKACLRAETADYCGNGNANTVTGVPLFLARVGAAPVGTEWLTTPEAIWSADGAICVNAPRVTYRGTTKDTVLDYITTNCPTARPAAGGACATTGTGAQFLSYVMGSGESPFCARGQACPR